MKSECKRSFSKSKRKSSSRSLLSLKDCKIERINDSTIGAQLIFKSNRPNIKFKRPVSGKNFDLYQIRKG